MGQNKCNKCNWQTECWTFNFSKPITKCKNQEIQKVINALVSENKQMMSKPLKRTYFTLKEVDDAIESFRKTSNHVQYLWLYSINNDGLYKQQRLEHKKLFDEYIKRLYRRRKCIIFERCLFSSYIILLIIMIGYFLSLH